MAEATHDIVWLVVLKGPQPSSPYMFFTTPIGLWRAIADNFGFKYFGAPKREFDIWQLDFEARDLTKVSVDHVMQIQMPILKRTVHPRRIR